MVSGGLKRHIKYKNQDKLFECSRCEALFSEADMLGNHLMSDKHSGEVCVRACVCGRRCACAEFVKFQLVVVRACVCVCVH